MTSSTAISAIRDHLWLYTFLGANASIQDRLYLNDNIFLRNRQKLELAIISKVYIYKYKNTDSMYFTKEFTICINKKPKNYKTASITLQILSKVSSMEDVPSILTCLPCWW